MCQQSRKEASRIVFEGTLQFTSSFSPVYHSAQIFNPKLTDKVSPPTRQGAEQREGRLQNIDHTCEIDKMSVLI